MTHIGHVSGIVRYPVKSMAGTTTESAFLGWHGLAGDRRFAFRRMGDDSGFPWLTAGRLPELPLYHPVGLDDSTGEPLPTHVRTPTGSHVELRSADLQAELAQRFGSGVDLMNLKHGIFDEAPISVISLATIAGISREAGLDLDRRRFRANIFVETERSEPFLEDAWVGRMLVFGERIRGGHERHAVQSALYDDQHRSGHGKTRCARNEDSRPAQQQQRGRICNGGAKRRNPCWRSSEPDDLSQNDLRSINGRYPLPTSQYDHNPSSLPFQRRHPTICPRI